MKIAKERIIFDNYDTEGLEEELRNDEEYKDFYDEDFDNLIATILDEEYDMAKEYLHEVFENKSIVCVGSCGRWDGVYSGGFVSDDIDEVLERVLKDCYYFKIWDENGHLFIQGTHHDGSITVEVKALTAKGSEYYDNWNYGSDNRTEREVMENLFKRYSVLPRLVERVWGGKRTEYITPTKSDLQRKISNEARSFYC